MARPEKPITWSGPLADLARELRRLRELTGPPIPTYTQLAERGAFSRSVLADAAAGYRCPSWEVVMHFVTACGGMPGEEPWPTLWKLAQTAAGEADDRAQRRAARAASGKSRASTRQATIAAPQQGPAPPSPWQAETAEEYRYRLGLLKVWAGVSIPEICRKSRSLDWHRGIAYTTVHDALNSRFTRMPPLRAVHAIVAACDVDVEQWVGAWRAINIKQFIQSNPPPPNLAR
jgi:hypothetical protein